MSMYLNLSPSPSLVCMFVIYFRAAELVMFESEGCRCLTHVRFVCAAHNAILRQKAAETTQKTHTNHKNSRYFDPRFEKQH